MSGGSVLTAIKFKMKEYVFEFISFAIKDPSSLMYFTKGPLNFISLHDVNPMEMNCNFRYFPF